MKRQRMKFKLLALLMFSLFLLLALYGGYSVITYGNRWFSSSRNPRVRAQKENVTAGNILDRNGVLLATTNEEGERIYPADETTRKAMVHLIGDSQGQVSNSVESFQTSYLYGFQTSFPEQLAALIRGDRRRGDDLTLTVCAPLCVEAQQAFDRYEHTMGKRGACVVMNWKTGELLAEISLPEFDPMAITGAVKQDEGQPFWNRATQSVYPPGSTFKVVTALAALSSIEDAEEQWIDCTEAVLDFGGGQMISDYGGEHHGVVHLREAFIHSCNKMFATLAVNAGQENMLRAAAAFGFNDNFLFRDLVVENSSFPEKADSRYTLAASGFGQSSVTATPMHMCMIAAAVANRGVMMEPRLLRSVVSPGGTGRLSYTENIYRTVMTETLASKLKDYMRQVVAEGTGRRADVSTMYICGKTGTADSTSKSEPITYGWFIGFNAQEDVPVALCVVVEDLDEGTAGGNTAAFIARDVFAWCGKNTELIIPQ